MRHLSMLVTFLAIGVGLASAQIQIVQSTAVYDGRYDDLATPTDYFACSDQLSGEYPNLYSFPLGLPPYNNFVGGSDTISNLDKSKCGTCYFVRNNANGNIIRFVAVDTSPKGFTLSGPAYYALTGQPPSDTSVGVVYISAAPWFCGLDQ